VRMGVREAVEQSAPMAQAITAAVVDGIAEGVRAVMPTREAITDAITEGVRLGVDDRFAT